MYGLHGTWRTRDAFGDVVLELSSQSVDAETARASLALVRRLVNDLRLSRPETRRTLVDVHARLRGQSWSPPDDRFIADELMAAARARTLVARRLERRSVVVRLDEASESVLGPDPQAGSAPDTKSWVGVVLLDQDGTPVPNRPYRVIQPDGTTVDGTLDSNGAAMLKGLDPGNCQIWCPYVPAGPGTTYPVKAGDHVSGVAQSFGFDDYADVWNHPDNADLAAQRPDPHVLQPGDTLAIPEVKGLPAANKPTGVKHPFQIQRSPLKLRLTLLDLAANPIAGAAVTIAGASLTTDPTGLVEATVDKSAQDATLDADGSEVGLSLGGLNPSDDASDAGYKARLFNLGFLWDPSAEEGDDEMLIAVQDFQAQYSLAVSGALDDATRTQLLQTYGA